jgi:hypothetical protein
LGQRPAPAAAIISTHNGDDLRNSIKLASQKKWRFVLPFFWPKKEATQNAQQTKLSLSTANLEWKMEDFVCEMVFVRSVRSPHQRKDQPWSA